LISLSSTFLSGLTFEMRPTRPMPPKNISTLLILTYFRDGGKNVRSVWLVSVTAATRADCLLNTVRNVPDIANGRGLK
jgi:hypothetical protein